MRQYVVDAFAERLFEGNPAAVCVPESPVTGSAHCNFIPYWAKRLGKQQMTARQISPRGGTLYCENCGERVKIKGKAVLYSEATLHLPAAMKTTLPNDVFGGCL